jgi:hypothetical protein
MRALPCKSISATLGRGNEEHKAPHNEEHTALPQNLLPVISFARFSDVDRYLKLYNIDLDTGKYRCAVCGDVITRENIYALIVNGSSIKLICNKPSR